MQIATAAPMLTQLYRPDELTHHLQGQQISDHGIPPQQLADESDLHGRQKHSFRLRLMSLKSGAPTFGIPEPILSNYAIGQMARAAGLPLRCGGSLTASKIEDAQAAYESADSMHSTMLAGANFVLHAAGWMEGGLCTGFEKLVMDADRLGGYQKLGAGLDSSPEALARDAYGEVEPAGHFLGSAHTMRNYRTAFYEPALSDSENVESWEEGGAKDMRQRAYERWTSLLRAYEPPPINAGVKEELQAYVDRRKSEILDAWY